MSLSRFIDANHDSILAEWEAFARTILPAAGGMDVTALRDHAEQMLRAIVEDMESFQTTENQGEKSKGRRADTAPAVTRVAREHANGRFADLFTQNQLVSEYRALRASVIRLWTDQMGMADRAALDGLTRFNEAIDQSLTEAIAAFASSVEHALRMADHRKNEFLATLAHELRNPLAPIRAAARIAKSPSATAAQLQWSHDVIDRQVHYMARLLDDLLDVSRITRGKLELRMEAVELAAIIDNALETARPIIDSRSHRLTVTLPKKEVHLYADTIRLAQVFSNILINAAKYSEPNGRIDLSAFVEGSVVVIKVRDSGIGIAPELLPRVFDMFAQATPARDRADGGLGIGLALVKGLVEGHRGSVQAHSEGLGGGSEFTVRLPITQSAKAHAMRAGRQRAESPQKPRRIVVADDNRDAVESLAMLLEFDGHDVLSARDGEEAFEVAAAARPEVMLLDVGMPKMNGYELAKRIRAEPWGSQVKLIAITGWGQEEDVRKAKAAGFDHHLTKPINHDEVQALLSELL
jgi:signal transduction histidine kinase